MAKILLIDDYPPFVRTVHLLLRQAGHTVHDAADGAEALTLFLRERHDLVITDLYMPRMDGLETIRRLKEINPKVSIIAISGGAQEIQFDCLPMAEALGAHRVLKKPIEPAALLEAIASLVPTNPAPAPKM